MKKNKFHNAFKVSVSMLILCIACNNVSKKQDFSLTQKELDGRWKTQAAFYTFNLTGSLERKDLITGDIESGNWELDNNVIFLTYGTSKTKEVFQVIDTAKNKIICIQNISGKNIELNLIKIEQQSTFRNPIPVSPEIDSNQHFEWINYKELLIGAWYDADNKSLITEFSTGGIGKIYYNNSNNDCYRNFTWDIKGNTLTQKVNLMICPSNKQHESFVNSHLSSEPEKKGMIVVKGKNEILIQSSYNRILRRINKKQLKPKVRPGDEYG